MSPFQRLRLKRLYVKDVKNAYTIMYGFLNEIYTERCITIHTINGDEHYHKDDEYFIARGNVYMDEIELRSKELLDLIDKSDFNPDDLLKI